MKWAKTLTIQNEDSIEKRLSSILAFLSKHYQSIECYVSGIDATGKFGNELKIKNNPNFLIVVQDGQHVDILGDGKELPSHVIGDHVDLEKSHYNF